MALLLSVSHTASSTNRGRFPNPEQTLRDIREILLLAISPIKALALIMLMTTDDFGALIVERFTSGLEVAVSPHTKKDIEEKLPVAGQIVQEIRAILLLDVSPTKSLVSISQAIDEGFAGYGVMQRFSKRSDQKVCRHGGNDGSLSRTPHGAVHLLRNHQKS